MKSSSQIACESLKIAPIGSPSKTEEKCCLCAAPIAIGGKCSPFKSGDGFMDDASLAGREASATRLVCGYCLPFIGRNVMCRAQRAVFSEEGVAYTMNKLPHKKWVLEKWFSENPPKGASVWVHNDTKMGHVVWKAPVTRSPDLISLQFGVRSMSIRKKAVLEAVGICRKFGASFPIKKGKSAARSPFLCGTDLPAASLDSGKLRFDADRYLTPAEMAHLFALSTGELWALEVLTSTKPAEPAPLVDVNGKPSPEDGDEE